MHLSSYVLLLCLFALIALGCSSSGHLVNQEAASLAELNRAMEHEQVSLHLVSGRTLHGATGVYVDTATVRYTQEGRVGQRGFDTVPLSKVDQIVRREKRHSFIGFAVGASPGAAITVASLVSLQTGSEDPIGYQLQSALGIPVGIGVAVVGGAVGSIIGSRSDRTVIYYQKSN